MHVILCALNLSQILNISSTLIPTYIENVNIDKYLIYAKFCKNNPSKYICMGGQIVGVVINWCILATSLSLTKLVVSFWKVSASYDLSFSAICTINHYPVSRQQKFSFKIWRSISSRSAKKMRFTVCLVNWEKSFFVKIWIW